MFTFIRKENVEAEIRQNGGDGAVAKAASEERGARLTPAGTSSEQESAKPDTGFAGGG